MSFCLILLSNGNDSEKNIKIERNIHKRWLI